MSWWGHAIKLLSDFNIDEGDAEAMSYDAFKKEVDTKYLSHYLTAPEQFKQEAQTSSKP